MPATVAILGHHPDLFPGFNALMTANLAYGLAEAGAEVTVFLPETASHPQAERMAALGLDPGTLDRFGAAFDIRILGAGAEVPGRYDLGIWQSYFAADEPFFAPLRAAVRVMAKNFPRLLTGERERDLKALSGSAGRFDIVGLSLRADHDLAQGLADAIPDAVARSIHMPRGFRPDWFGVPLVGGPPVLGIEKGVETDGSEYDYLVPVIAALRARHGPIEVIGARMSDPRLVTRSLGLLPARQFYARFLGPLWAYLMIDVNRSRQSINAVTVNGRRVYPGLYENQVVEAQHAGAAVLGQADALPAELVASGRVGLRFADFGDTAAMVDFLSDVIASRPAVAAEAQAWARRHHAVANMVRPLLDAL